MQNNCLSSCNTWASKDFSSIVLNPDKYRFSDNWAELQQEGDILLFYKIINYKDSEIITNFYYSLRSKDNQLIYLGGYDVHRGFINNNKRQFVLRKAVSGNTRFIKKDLLGISIKLLDEPFIIKGIVQDKDNKLLYETETLEYFFIDEKNKTIKEWFPSL